MSEAVDTKRLVGTLRETRPWVRFFAVLSSIGVGLTALGGIVFLLLGRMFYREAPLSTSLLGVLYLVLAGVLVYPSLLLHQYAGKLRDFAATGTVEDLEGAMDRQLAFWKGYGVLTLVLLGLAVAGSVVVVLFVPISFFTS